jgi:hypothetical protein
MAIEHPFASPMPRTVAGWLLPEVNGWTRSFKCYLLKPIMWRTMLRSVRVCDDDNSLVYLDSALYDISAAPSAGLSSSHDRLVSENAPNDLARSQRLRFLGRGCAANEGDRENTDHQDVAVAGFHETCGVVQRLNSGTATLTRRRLPQGDRTHVGIANAPHRSRVAVA